MAVPHDHGVGGETSKTLSNRLKHALVTGIALTIPLLVTLLVVAFVVNLVSSRLTPIVRAFVGFAGLDSTTMVVFAAQLATIAGIVVFWVAVGLAVQTDRGRRVEVFVDDLIEGVPGIGSVYSSFNEMSELLVQSDSRSFREVVLVEYPQEGAYSLAFLTTDEPTVVRECVGAESMRAVFMPMGPNPFMGGFVLYLDADDVHDVDLSVEEGLQAVVTSGAAIAEDAEVSAATVSSVEPPNDPAAK